MSAVEFVRALMDVRSGTTVATLVATNTKARMLERWLEKRVCEASEGVTVVARNAELRLHRRHPRLIETRTEELVRCKCGLNREWL